jgi:hypothetical protein
MSFLRQRSKTAVAPTYTGMQIQTSSGALPIPILWGANQIAPNVIWSGNFQAVPQYAQSAGKGGGKTATGYDYQSAVIMGLCEGPIEGVGTIWNSQTVSTLASLGLTLFNGETPQAAWSYLSTAFPTQALGYNGTAYVCSSDYDMGSSAGIDALTFEVQGALTSTAVVNGSDADPALIIRDFLTNPQYGVGFPAAGVDGPSLLGASGDSSYQTYCQAAGLALSPALVNQEAANSILARWLQLTNTAAVWSGGLLKFIPYGDSSISGTLTSGASVAFNPNLTPVYDLDDDDFVQDDDADPLEVARTDPYAAYNMQILEISQRSNYYDATPIVVFDQNAIEDYGLRIAATVTAHEICDPNVAQIAGQLILQRSLYIRNAYSFKLSWEYCLLEPMDLVTLTDARLGLSKTAVRIVDIEEDDRGLLTVTAEEFPGGTATATAYPVQAGSSSPVNRGVAPAPVNPPLIFEPPPALTGGNAEVWMAASGGQSGAADPNWGGAYVWLSTDDAAYSQIGQIASPARQGALTAALAAFAAPNPDTIDALAVNMAESNGLLAAATTADAQNAVTLSVVDQELLAYANATLTGPNAYALTYLVRGLYGSTPAAHAAGAPFARLDQAIFKYPLPEAFLGQTVYVKLQSFNVFGQALQDLSTCVAYPYTPQGSGLLGPVAQALAVGADLDYGLASGALGETDDFGMASDPYVTVADLGLASG